MGLDLDNEMKASYIDAEKAYWKFVAEPTVDPVALALRSVAAELRAARYTRREQPVEVNAIRLAQTDAVLDSPAGSEWVRATDYDTLKERADALEAQIVHLQAVIEGMREVGRGSYRELEERIEKLEEQLYGVCEVAPTNDHLYGLLWRMDVLEGNDLVAIKRTLTQFKDELFGQDFGGGIESRSLRDIIADVQLNTGRNQREADERLDKLEASYGELVDRESEQNKSPITPYEQVAAEIDRDEARAERDHARLGIAKGVRRLAEVEAERDRLREAVERIRQTISDWGFGSADKPPPATLDEWGPVCAGCGDKEFRVDGFCSVECRDRYEFAHDILRALLDGEPEGWECDNYGVSVKPETGPSEGSRGNE